MQWTFIIKLFTQVNWTAFEFVIKKEKGTGKERISKPERVYMDTNQLSADFQ